MKAFAPAAAAALVFIGLAGAAPVMAQPAPALGVLGLSASASVDVTHDLLSVTFSTTRDGAAAAAVQLQLKQALDAALAEAKQAARPERLEVRTGNFSLSPRHAPKGGITGWQGTAEMIVEGRDLAAIGALTGRITTLTVQQVRFDLSREARQKVEGQVAAEAIAAFRTRAADYAKQFGFAGYDIREVNVSTSDMPPRPYPMARMRAMSASPASGEALPVEAGKASVSASVNGTVQMK